MFTMTPVAKFSRAHSVQAQTTQAGSNMSPSELTGNVSSFQSVQSTGKQHFPVNPVDAFSGQTPTTKAGSASLKANRQVRFGNEMDDFLDAEENVMEAAEKLEAAWKTYQQDVGHVSRQQDVAALLNRVEDALNSGERAKTDTGFKKAVADSWGFAAKTTKDATPYLRAVGRDIEEMRELLDRHKEILKQLDKRYEAVKKAGLLSRADQLKFERRRRTFEQERGKLAEQLSGKAAVLGTRSGVMAFVFGIDAAGEIVKGFKNIITLHWGKGWNSHEIKSAVDEAKRYSKECKKQLGSAFRAAGTGLQTSYVPMFRELVIAPAEFAQAGSDISRFTKKQKERIDRLATKTRK